MEGGEDVQVFCRVRPLNDRENKGGIGRKCLETDEEGRSVTIDCKPNAKTFTFDYVAGENTPQHRYCLRRSIRVFRARILKLIILSNPGCLSSSGNQLRLQQCRDTTCLCLPMAKRVVGKPTPCWGATALTTTRLAMNED
jgi:hypothetical protein